jgi:hypothetical protein
VTAKERYRVLCREETSIPIFSKDWWLDAVCGDAWDVALVEQRGQIVASMPYTVSKGLIFTYSTQPALTQTLGPWIKVNEKAKHSKILASEKETMNELIDQMPYFDHFRQNWHYSRTNWLPFYWRGFKQTTRYTYVIPDLSDLEFVWSNFDHSKRKNIKRATASLEVVFDVPANEFYDNHAFTLNKQGNAISYKRELFYRIYNIAYAKNRGRTIGAYDDKGNLHAALFVIWDDLSAYDLISTIDPEFRNSGAASLLVQEIIRFVSKETPRFDFEGSMIEPVEQSFRRFGAIQMPYFSVSYTPSKLVRAGQCFRSLLR